MTDIPFTSSFSGVCCALRGLRGLVGGWGKRGILSHALMWLVYRRISSSMAGFDRLSARFLAGLLRASAPRAVAVAGERARTAAGKRIWPGKFSWLCGLVAWEAGQWGAPLRHALEQPEVQALLKASPQAGRVLLPVCRMLGIEASLLRPGVPAKVRQHKATETRVRRKPAPVDWGRVPLPRGVLAAAKRQGFGKPPRASKPDR